MKKTISQQIRDILKQVDFETFETFETVVLLNNLVGRLEKEEKTYEVLDFEYDYPDRISDKGKLWFVVLRGLSITVVFITVAFPVVYVVTEWVMNTWKYILGL